MQRSVRNVAMDLLSRRDHSHKELFEKLRLRSFEADEIIQALDRLQSENLLNDERFCESYIHYRAKKGFGPIRIRNELVEKGVDSELIQHGLATYESRWSELMQQQRLKRFGADIPDDYKEKMKQARFLQNKGFSPESVMRMLR